MTMFKPRRVKLAMNQGRMGDGSAKRKPIQQPMGYHPFRHGNMARGLFDVLFTITGSFYEGSLERLKKKKAVTKMAKSQVQTVQRSNLPRRTGG